ncbi:MULTISPECIES: hypothetical protein [unclassified Mesorhizobium]|uniref:hypothetical protein n=1 Tax=unclassified Mesorhizobium TaxID=325217 RepID=UPI000FD7F76E|nr:MULTISPECIES: hypothetical protein [unclassified Mesorhizobium]TGQ05861.1 hypothetical protein EN862_031030 [Mesorhizobium sp. M2E.F.Ca.ET.219.01.1.1]TGT71633.1 hypothetical protein EN809_015650 [Mesorhizobium sp. M2E.F.Ca.ET.166.01.1.1]TGV99651.1 hypothetical protein EN797_025600 [Mesorhizobium sp. M2E.F.Ca.ET.154.01.1.1]
MTTAEDIIENETARLRPAGVPALKPAQQPAGPFEVAAKPSARDALVTGLLVIYPAFAAVAAILAGLFLAGASSV